MATIIFSPVKVVLIEKWDVIVGARNIKQQKNTAKSGMQKLEKNGEKIISSKIIIVVPCPDGRKKVIGENEDD